MGERQFGPYRLVRQVAVGGMAEIHLAKTKGIAGFEKYVALKMIHPNFAEDEQFIQMLIDEAKIAVQLQHVNIAQTFDLGRVGEHYYITLEYVDGSDLYKILRRGSEQDLDVPIDVCAYVAKEVTTGLDYAHRKKDMAGNPLGIVHRDVSPQNVLVSHAGEVKLVDFGIAKAASKVRQTAAGVIKGKYYYMSPEQAWGDKLDHRSDIFSAGIVLYEMLTGQMLYLEEDLHRLLDIVRKADIAPPTRLRPDVPPQLERIVMKALARVPGERYQQAADMANELERFLHTYSPVFTAAKLAKHLRSVMGDPIAITAAPPPSDDPVISTLEISDEELLHDRAELRDENSVIFRLDGVKAGEKVKRAPTPQPVPARSPSSPTSPIPRAIPAPGSGPVRSPKPTGAPAPRMEIPRITQRPPGGTQPPPMGQPSAGPPAPALRPATPRPPTEPPPAQPSARAATPAPLGPAPARPTPRPTTKPRDPSEATRPVDARMIAASTWSMEDDGDEEGLSERTVISAPPGFEGDKSQTTQDGATPGFQTLHTEDVQFEPTTIESGGASTWDGAPTATATPTTTRVRTDDDSDDDQLTIAGHGSAGHGGAGRGGDDDDERTLPPGGRRHRDDDEDGPTLTRGPAVRGPGQMAPAVRAPRAPGNPALTASTPTPSVSEVRKPARSRKTPTDGVPAGQPSVLQAIVGAAGSEPMPARPRPPTQPPPLPSQMPATQAMAPAPTVPPHQAPTLPPSADMMAGPMPGQYVQQPPPQQQPYGGQPQYGTQPAPQYGTQPPPYGSQPQYGTQPPYGSYPQQPDPAQQQPQMYPQMNQLPAHAVPTHLQPYAGNPSGGGWPQQVPYAGLPGSMAAAQQQVPFQPYGGQPQQPTFTQQMRAVIELDEIPAHYKVQTGPRWLVLVLAALVAIAGAAVVTYFILRKSDDQPATASLRVDSTPSGATVTIDGKQLPNATPVQFAETKPGQRHSVKIVLPGYKPYEEEIVVPSAGGEYRVSPVLQSISGKLLIDTIPSGAEVFIKGELKGTTPRTITDLEIASTKELELRHKDFGARTVPLVWPESGTITLNVDLKK